MTFWTFLCFKQINCFYFNTFYFVFNVFMFLYNYQFLFSFPSLFLWLFLLLLLLLLSLPLLFLHFHAFNFCFSNFYHSILSMHMSNISKFCRTNGVAKHCSKLAVETLRLYQCLWWELWTLFTELILLTIFFQRDTIIFCPW